MTLGPPRSTGAFEAVDIGPVRPLVWNRFSDGGLIACLWMSLPLTALGAMSFDFTEFLPFRATAEPVSPTTKATIATSIAGDGSFLLLCSCMDDLPFGASD